MSLNKVMLIGNVGSDANIRTVGDRKVASFNLATTERRKDKDGNVIQETEWHSIVIWGNLAEVVEKYVSKGAQLYIEGKIKTEKYTDKDGNDRYAVRIYASSLQLLGSKKEESAPTPVATPSPAPQPRVVRSTPIVDDLPPDDSGLPF